MDKEASRQIALSVLHRHMDELLFVFPSRL